ncbi:TetR/AcrR family transcriptional regulator C-terminal domain-containing protein [Streptosporangium roseum]|uniref:TetR/AcrR family transcriptional regulator C-terminal domain-containing protein n=1 Tax=Streptosporangium roseum TaxID=2001 RepID=UPI00068D7E78|nr:TetR/AcrR family transcriptional regulator C-terminal domain-containing protein [Streptosporangium roseum]
MAIVKQGLALLNEVGLDGLSLRRLARELGVQAPALYRHFAGKDDLLHAMADAMFDAEMAALDRPPPGADWGDWLAERSRAVRRAMLSYRDGGRLREHMDDPADHWPGLELLLQMMEEAGFTAEEALSAVFAVGNHVLGSVIAEQESRQFDRPSGRDVHIDPRRFPRLARAATLRTCGRDFEGEFEYGLKVFIAGLRGMSARAR